MIRSASAGLGNSLNSGPIHSLVVQTGSLMGGLPTCRRSVHVLAAPRPIAEHHPMKIHEYQAKDLLKAAGVAVQEGIVASTPEEAADAFARLSTPLGVVKSQVHAGGRGKGIAIGAEDDRAEALAIASGQKPRPDRRQQDGKGRVHGDCGCTLRVGLGAIRRVRQQGPPKQRPILIRAGWRRRAGPRCRDRVCR